MSNEQLMNSGDAWETEGIESRPLVTNMNVLLVTGMDATATSRLALGLSRAESAERTVTMTDLWGELPVVEQLAGDHDGHGIADVLLFGASPGRVTRQVPGHDAFRVITSGNDDVAREPVFVADRWSSLFSRERETNSLLVLICRADTPGLKSLSERADGVLVVGEGVEAALSNVIVAVKSAAPAHHVVYGSGAADAPAVPSTPPSREGDATPREPRLTRDVQRFPMIILLLLAGLGAAALIAPRLGGPGVQAMFARLKGGSEAAVIASASAESIVQPPRILNPSDSSRAAMYAVEIAVLNTSAGADIRLAELTGISGSTISPVANKGDTWYRVFAGALTTRESAETLQMQLRSRELQMAEGDRIVRLPIALRLAQYPSNAEAAAAEGLSRYISLGIPAYLLAQPDGSMIIYAGAFENLEQGAHLGELCASKGIPPRFVYRTGR